MATTFMDKQQKQLLKKFYVLLGKAGIGNEGKEAILHSYGVESSKELSAHDLMDICNRLEMEADPELKELDKHRKRLIAVIFGYFKASGKQTTMNEVKAVACRAAKCQTFNTIGKDRLISLYNAFKNRVNDIEAVNNLSFGDLLNGVNLN